MPRPQGSPQPPARLATLRDTPLCPQAFVCQINLSELPGAVQERLGRRAGLFQLFYCLECMPLYCTQDIAVLPPAHLVPSLKSQAARVAARSSSNTVSPPEIGSLDRKTIDRFSKSLLEIS